MLENIHATHPIDVTLGKWIAAVQRSHITTPKRSRPALMPHGRFVGGRRATDCVERSAVVQFDIDTKHNPGLSVDAVKRRAAGVPSIVFLARSASDGCYGFALNTYASTSAMFDELERALGVTLDRVNSQSVTALRFASYDPHHMSTFDKLQLNQFQWTILS